MHEFPFHRRVRVACILAIWGPLMACQPTAPAGAPTGTAASTAKTTGAQKNDKSEQAHLFKVNPYPKQVFEVEFEIHDAPGPLTHAISNVNYQSFNCNFVTSEWAGARASPSKMMPLTVSRLAQSRYAVTVFRDGLLNEDYYGTGVCQWSLTAISIGFGATGATDDTSYVVHLRAKDLQDGTAIKQYYWKGDYPRLPGAADTSSAGGRSPEEFGPTHRNNLFSITAQVKAKP